MKRSTKKMHFFPEKSAFASLIGLKQLLLSVIILLSSVPVCADDTEGELRVHLPGIGAEFRYPAEFSIVPGVTAPGGIVPLVVLANPGGSTTLNALVTPGALADNLYQAQANLRREYAAVGLGGLKMREGQATTIGGRQSWSFTLNYRHREKDVSSLVALVPVTSSSYLVVTFVTDPSSFETERRLFDTVVRSLTFTGEAPARTSESDTHTPFIGVTLALMLGAIMFFLLWRRRHKS